MRRHGGSTAGDNANGFDDTNSIKTYDARGNTGTTATHIGMDAAGTASASNTKTTATRYVAQQRPSNISQTLDRIYQW